METAINQLLELVAVFGLGVLAVLAAAFWLFHKVKQAADERDQASRRPPATNNPETPHGTH